MTDRYSKPALITLTAAVETGNAETGKIAANLAIVDNAATKSR